MRLMPLCEWLAPGVQGYTVEHGGATYIPILLAKDEGNGDVGRYLDSLPRDRTLKVPCVLSRQLRDMLTRRGFVIEQEWSEDFGEHVEVFTRRPTP